MECPCEKCLVRPVCRSRVVKKSNRKGDDQIWLVMEYLEECPMIIDYFTVVNKRVIYTYKKINEVCKYMNIHNTQFVWYANEIGL